MENKLEMILKEIKSNKSASTVTNPGSETNENDYPLRASKMKDSRHPARPIFHNESDVDVTINPEDESDAEEVEDYHIDYSHNLPHIFLILTTYRIPKKVCFQTFLVF